MKLRCITTERKTIKIFHNSQTYSVKKARCTHRLGNKKHIQKCPLFVLGISDSPSLFLFFYHQHITIWSPQHCIFHKQIKIFRSFVLPEYIMVLATNKEIFTEDNRKCFRHMCMLIPVDTYKYICQKEGFFYDYVLMTLHTTLKYCLTGKVVKLKGEFSD